MHESIVRVAVPDDVDLHSAEAAESFSLIAERRRGEFPYAVVPPGDAAEDRLALLFVEETMRADYGLPGWYRAVLLKPMGGPWPSDGEVEGGMEAAIEDTETGKTVAEVLVLSVTVERSEPVRAVFLVG